eukprot:6414490-Pyramimonas_sp.AAC.1
MGRATPPMKDHLAGADGRWPRREERLAAARRPSDENQDLNRRCRPGALANSGRRQRRHH